MYLKYQKKWEENEERRRREERSKLVGLLFYLFRELHFTILCKYLLIVMVIYYILH